MKDKDCIFQDRAFSPIKWKQESDAIQKAFVQLEKNIDEALSSGFSVAQIKDFRTDAAVKRFIESARDEYIKSFRFLPEEEKKKIYNTYAGVYERFSAPVIAVSDIINDDKLVIEYSAGGRPRVNVQSSLEAAKKSDRCFDMIDTEKLKQLYRAVTGVIDAIEVLKKSISSELKVDAEMTPITSLNPAGTAAPLYLSDIVCRIMNNRHCESPDVMTRNIFYHSVTR